MLGKWLDDLWTDGKLSHEVYDGLARKVRTSYSTRKRDVELVRSTEKDERVDETLAAVEKELAKLRAPFRRFPEVIGWEDSFLSLKFRWKLLVLVADSAANAPCGAGLVRQVSGSSCSMRTERWIVKNGWTV